jgi:heptosyltransferase-3
MSPLNPKKILVVKLKHIGDVLLTVPAVRALHEAFPGSEITAFVNAGTEEMLAGLPYVHDMVVYDRRMKRLGWIKRCFKEITLMRAIRRRGFDLAVDFSGGDRGALCVLLSGAAVRCGYAKTGKGMFLRDRCFTHVVPPDFSKHTVDVHLDLVRALGIEGKSRTLDIALSDADRERVRDVLRAKGIGERERYVVVHPTSRWFFKCWRKDGFAATADHIAVKHGARVIFTSAPDDREREMVQDILRLSSKPHVDVGGMFSLKQLAALIKGAALFIGIDSAPMHMAQAVRTPVIVLFGPSGVHNWGPRGEHDTVICRDWECVPCGKDGCQGTKKSRCLDDITPQEVMKEVDHFFGQRRDG